MKIAIAQNNYHTGNFDENLAKILASVAKAKAAGASLVVFSELAITGYPPRDFLEFEHFLTLSQQAIDRIAEAAENIAVVVGGPAINTSGQGKPLWNAAYFLAEGKVQQVVAKTLLPTYDVFDEYRYFEPASSNQLVDFQGKRLAITICEDLWNVGHHAKYQRDPLVELGAEKADLIINIAASPFSKNQHAERAFVLGEAVKKYGKPLVYVNHVGAQTELIFDGCSQAWNPAGEVVMCLPDFEEGLGILQLEELELNAISPKQPTAALPLMEQLEAALVIGVRDYFRKLGFGKAILGLSGGIDSALVTVLAVKALGPENVHVLLMPSRYSSDHSVDDSLALVKNLGITHELIPIEKVFSAYEHTLAPYFTGKPADLTEENLQSRIRGMLLMAFTNKFGYILLNTSNKSELAVGYGTLYGDMCGGLSVIGDLYKTEVFELCRFINRDAEIIPWNIITKPPSAELRPDQKDSDSLPAYEVLDEILQLYIESRKSPAEIRGLGYDESVVNKVMRLVNMNEYKRHQTPPILRVSSKAFGMGRRMPIVARYLT